MMASPDHINLLLSIIPLANENGMDKVASIAKKVESKVIGRTISFEYKGISYLLMIT